MSANKDGKKWRCQFYYVDWQGVRRKKNKRGFMRKRDALEWEKNFKESMQKYMSVRFDEFARLYLDDMDVRLRVNTVRGKRYLFEKHIIPYFKNMYLCDIKPPDIRGWQNEMLKREYSPTYLKQLNSQLKALFSYAEKYYGLNDNPCRRAGSIGNNKTKELNFWTREEFEVFIKTLSSDEDYADRLIFLLLYWTGMRVGELLALTPNDINTEEGSISITKSYQRIKGQDVTTPPKSKKGVRAVTLPDFLCYAVAEYIIRKGCPDDGRIFGVSRFHIEYSLKRHADMAKLHRIRVHDLRHSHASLLIEMGVTPLLIAERLGHEKIETTLDTYSHLYPGKQRELAQKLNDEYGLAP